MSDLAIPDSHWREGPQPLGGIETYRPSWENRLRKTVQEEPDPSARFTRYLNDLAAGTWRPGPRLIFFEQPYLMWAEAIERVINATEASTRKQIAHEVEFPDA